jgi:hypothetical protein
MTDADENADLKRRVAELEAKLTPPSPAQREKEDREYMSKVHADRERRMNLATNFFTKEDLKAFEAACPTSAVRDIVSKGLPPGPVGMAPSSAQVSAVHSSPGLPGTQGTGWIAPRPLSNPPGIDHIDRLMDEQDRRDKVELAERIAKQKLATGQ